MSKAAATFMVKSGFVSGTKTVRFQVANTAGGLTGMNVKIAVSAGSWGNLVPIDLDKFTVGTPIQLGKCPTVISTFYPDNYDPFEDSASPMLYVANTCDGTVSIVDPSSGTVVQTIKMPFAATAFAIEP